MQNFQRCTLQLEHDVLSLQYALITCHAESVWDFGTCRWGFREQRGTGSLSTCQSFRLLHKPVSAKRRMWNPSQTPKLGRQSPYQHEQVLFKILQKSEIAIWNPFQSTKLIVKSLCFCPIFAMQQPRCLWCFRFSAKPQFWCTWGGVGRDWVGQPRPNSWAHISHPAAENLALTWYYAWLFSGALWHVLDTLLPEFLLANWEYTSVITSAWTCTWFIDDTLENSQGWKLLASRWFGAVCEPNNDVQKARYLLILTWCLHVFTAFREETADFESTLFH